MEIVVRIEKGNGPNVISKGIMPKIEVRLIGDVKELGCYEKAIKELLRST